MIQQYPDLIRKSICFISMCEMEFLLRLLRPLGGNGASLFAILFATFSSNCCGILKFPFDEVCFPEGHELLGSIPTNLAAAITLASSVAFFPPIN